uniref:Peptidase M41 domain-containing protein n=1 Tax=Guillardia theta (strain CCMP2712) TaxID=905079 RepID=A0A0C3T434_GUITC
MPFAFLGMGLSVPGLLQLVLIQIRRAASQEYRERLLWHEAGHFLVGYCLGLPIAAYSADDPILNAVQFFDSEEDSISHEFLDVLCAVSTAGVVAEAIRFGDAIGGYADFSQLQSFLYRSRPRLNDREQQERVRWGCVAAFTILKNREESLKALIEAMSRKSSISQCILAIES